ncbi:MAG: 3-isopropylmalate dehydratase [Kiloniellales bacterium]|nr:3-isopropylmalate dehydratase [Kiloniellales bacterium]
MTGEGGKAWVYGDDVDTDALAPGAYMKAPIEVLAAHCLEAIDPSFAAGVKPGDVVVGGRNFGLGSSREQAAQALRHLGVVAVVAESFAGLFYRNALNLGLAVLVCPEARSIRFGDKLRVDPAAGRIENLTSGDVLACEPIPDFLMAMLRDGGLVPHLEKKIEAQRKEASP